MPPKGVKRKASGDANDTAPLQRPDRTNWPGWVELESEPEIFNILLKDMGVRGISIREVESLDNAFMYTLPLPIHGLIFLFQYNDTDHYSGDDGGHVDDIWFANQVPEYACASIAILNLVNNIPGLDLGRELRDFKEFTKDMDPLMRGDTIDSFDFVKRIHNSYARETDMLNADMSTLSKVQKAKQQQKQQKARETRELNKAKKATLKETSAKATKPASKSTIRLGRAAKRHADASLTTGAPPENGAVAMVSDPSDSSEESDKGYDPKAAKDGGDDAKAVAPPRRSGRVPKPRKVVTAADYEEEPDSGFHYVAYIPIGDNVWKLDGMDKYPQNLGSIKQEGGGAGSGAGDWLNVVTPMIQSRMEEHSGDLNFCLMAVVRDPLFDEQRKLLENVRTLQAVDLKLDSLNVSWREFDGAETRKDTITGISIEFGVTQQDIEESELPTSAEEFIAGEDDLLKLIEYRQGVLNQQTMLRSGVRDARESSREGEDSIMRKHDYGPFVREWLGALAEEGQLANLLE